MKPHEILHLGYPQGAMLNFLPKLPIVMRQRVIRKGSEKKHDVEVSGIMDMPNHLATPIFIFQRSVDTIGVLTDMKDRTGKNVCVAIELKRQMQDGNAYLEVNDVRSFHGRDFKNVVEPIVNNHTLKWVDKSKGLAYLSSASQPDQQEIDRQVLEDAAKIVIDFENPQLSDENILEREGNGAPADAEISEANDLWVKVWGESFRTKRQKRMFAERERRRMRERVETLSAQLGVEIEVEEDSSRLRGRRRKAKGWYDTRTGRITIVLGND